MKLSESPLLSKSKSCPLTMSPVKCFEEMSKPASLKKKKKSFQVQCMSPLRPHAAFSYIDTS